MKYLGSTAFGAVALGLLFAALPVQAQTATTTSALTTQLQGLLKQVADLQAEMEKLNKQRADLTQQIIDTRIALTKNLREGMTDEEVKVLQELLALDPTVYPEGLVTGYYGPLTTKAVMKFQEKYGIETVGMVGPKTLAKLNEEVSKGSWKSGNLPPGIAKKFSSSTVEMLPPGIYKKFLEQFWSKKLEDDDEEEDEDDDDEDSATSTLSIEDVEVDETGATSARVKWHMDEKSTGTLYYSTDSPIDMDATSTVKKTSSSRKSHDIRLSGLADGETYYFIIVAKNADDEVETDELSFTLDGEDDKDLTDDVDEDEEDDD